MSNFYRVYTDLLNMLLIKAAIELFFMRPVVSLAKVML